MASLSPSRRALAAARLIVILTLCASNTIARAQASPRTKRANAPGSNRLTGENLTQLARTVTIYRDTYRVPHVFGRTDASTVFGFAYAQAEDYFWRVEENFIWALGRASELYGEESL